MMRLGMLARSMMAQIQEAEGPCQVTAMGMRGSEIKSRIRTARKLEKAGLLKVERRISEMRWPRRIVLWMSFTDLGAEIAEYFGHQLRSGGRITGRRYQQLTGRALPGHKTGHRPSWLTNNRHRASSSPLASMASQTAAQ